MKLTTLRDGTRDGRLVVATRDLRRATHEEPFMRFGNRVRVEMPDAGDTSVLGAIEQRIVSPDEAQARGAA